MKPLRKFGLGRMHEGDRYALAFIVLAVVSVTMTWTFLRSKETGNGRYDDYSRHGALHRGGYNRSIRSGGGTWNYLQKDIGYGDGSVSATRDDLADHLFPFDPNTADSTALLKLGLKPWQVRNIYKYRAHGGRYHRPNDFARLYGLTQAQFNRLKPYIRIEREAMARETAGMAVVTHDAYIRKLTLDDAKVDINTADTTLLKRIPGIGSYFSRRIVDMRQRRKVIVSETELLSIRDFPETALAYMTVSNDFPLIRINTMTLEELQRHPLLNDRQSGEITALRRTSGRIASLQDMSLLKSFPSRRLEALAPFIVFE